MAVCFFDTSALVKYHHPEVGSQKVVSLIDDPTNRIFISRLTLIEWHSAFAGKVRTGTLSSSNFLIAQKGFYTDLRARKFSIISLERSHQQHAVRLLKTYASTQNLRTLDALQLAIALDFRKRSPLDHFVCADAAFCQIGQQEGLSVINPEENTPP
ncbi:MAG: type II toxin-antitoxin system VapC family toxin [bacterium]|nr:type II toxin-antitoxin system VapC family toxin [bacterium]